MPKGKKIVSYVETIPDGIKRVNDFPLYAVGNVIGDCKTRDDVRKMFRESKPINHKDMETKGIFITSIDSNTGYKEIEQMVNAYTIDIDKVFLSENVKIIGHTDKFVYVEETDGKVRELRKDITFFTIC